MSTTTTTLTNQAFTPPQKTRLELRTAYGPVYRDVLPNPPRDCTAEEIPVLDLSVLFREGEVDGEKQGKLDREGNEEGEGEGEGEEIAKGKRKLADELGRAAEGTGFFYIKNHGISFEIMENAQTQLHAFFHQPPHLKALVTRSLSKYYNGYRGPSLSKISPSETPDINESLAWRYTPVHDPLHNLLAPAPPPHPITIPDAVAPWLRHEDFVWEGTAHLPGFKEDVLKYWAACLGLARKLSELFALSLGLEEEWFARKTDFPGADGVFNFYPVRRGEQVERGEVGLGSHTDLQLFTLLWQDMIGGLQVLTKEGQWIKAPPIRDTFVVNIGDFMMRLSNDRYKSTVHRVFNESNVERISMPFFFGLNFNLVEGVIPTCASPTNPARYEPISCGDWCQLRFKVENDAMNARLAAEAEEKRIEEEKCKAAPSALVVEA